MKTINQLRYIPLLAALLLGAACEEQTFDPVLNTDIAPNELMALSSDSYVLDRANADQTFQTFQWQAPDYGFQAAVNYRLQIDEADNNFADAVDVKATSDTSAAPTVAEMNTILLNMGLSPDEPAQVAVRVLSDINDEVAPVLSTVQTITITPYATSFPPIYMIGEALKGWDTAKAVEMLSTAPNEYETIAEFHNGGSFRFFSAPAWDAPNTYNWTYFDGGSVDANFANAEDGDTNLRFTGTTGFYRITVNLKTKSIALEAVEKPSLYMIGAALKGWDTTKAVPLEWLRHGVFQTTTEFTGGETFRFFTKPDWTTGFGNFPYFAEGYVDPLFENAQDGDQNFRFTGETGSYTITVNLLDLTVELE
jgi:hypothetical protein